MFSRNNSNISFRTSIISNCTYSLSVGIKVDEFCYSMSRQSEINGHRTLKTYSVSDSYGRFGVHNSLSCWEDNKFRETFEENLQFIHMYPYGDSIPYIQELGLTGPFMESSAIKIPVFVTAASSNHFLEVQAQIKNLHNIVYPNYINLKFIFYDIGLSETEKEMVKKHCRCEYRSFPFEKFPEHVKFLNGYTFKPLIAQIVLNEYGFMLWMDASVRFLTGKLDNLFQMAVKDGVKLILGGLGVGYRTDPLTFKYLGEDPCLYADKNEIEASFILLYRNHFTIETIMRPWVSCALTSGCMYFPGSQKRISCYNQKGLGFCHRFDQSIMSIILWRLYHANFGKVLIPGIFFDIQKENTSRYFESLEKKSSATVV
ncbi:hypothetical protein CHS0354_007101 [Potamilus streckersoni]|uniref:Uncharacterized protein n=1 Tax=Potamilus streckersoni TaxID=2493646 RepID=A0AAE0WA91_9BIVA|nr:hypothetical protein CHS0354_007101 [Potamilus streckersoni]